MRQNLPQSRIGDAERDAAIDRLSDHFAAGRLDLDEFEERSARVLRAKTQADLDQLFVDLPISSRPAPTEYRASPRRTKAIVSTLIAGLATVAVLLGVSVSPDEPAMPVSVCRAEVQQDCVGPDELEPIGDPPR